MTPTAIRRPAPDSPAKQVDGFIAKFDPTKQRLIRAMRTAMRKRLPTAVELIYDNYNFFVIGYGPNERATDAVFSIAANSKNVGVAFLQGATLHDPRKLLLGAGKRNRFIRFTSAAGLDDPDVQALMRAAIAQAKVPFPATGGIRTVVKSVSAKQRPRREPAKA